MPPVSESRPGSALSPRHPTVPSPATHAPSRACVSLPVGPPSLPLRLSDFGGAAAPHSTPLHSHLHFSLDPLRDPLSRQGPLQDGETEASRLQAAKVTSGQGAGRGAGRTHSPSAALGSGASTRGEATPPDVAVPGLGQPWVTPHLCPTLTPAPPTPPGLKLHLTSRLGEP